MSLIAKSAVKHDGLLFTVGQHVDADGAGKARLIALDAVDPDVDDRAAEKATEARRMRSAPRKPATPKKTAAKTAAVVKSADTDAAAPVPAAPTDGTDPAAALDAATADSAGAA